MTVQQNVTFSGAEGLRLVAMVRGPEDGQPVLLTGMRVDVFFRSETAVSSAVETPAKAD